MMGYIREIVLAGDEEPAKTRTITLYKSELVDDINQLTYKYSEKVVEGSVSKGMVESDTKDNLDGTILARFMKYRDAKLRRMMRQALAEETVESATDRMTIDEDFVYNILVSDNFSDSVLESLTELMHKYVVWGALRDWYMHLGERQIATDIEGDLDELEDELGDILRSPSIAKRPMQPFGPAHRGGDFV